jgi:FkbM family methyltransferase
LLQKNIRLSQLKNITVHPIAAGQTERDRQFHVAEDYVNSGFFLGPYSGTARTINVAERPLDDLIRSPVDCVKMDIQGTELEALGGMRRLLRENEGLTLLVEWQPACMKSAGYDPFDLSRFLRDAGFSKISALDDRSSTIRTLEEMTDIFSQDPTSLGYCNLLATKA